MMISIILDNEFTMESCYPIPTACKRQKGASFLLYWFLLKTP